MPIPESPFVVQEEKYPSVDGPRQRNELREKAYGAEMKLRYSLGISKVLDKDGLDNFFRQFQLAEKVLVFSVNSSTFRLRRIQLRSEIIGLDPKSWSWDHQRAYILERYDYQGENIPKDLVPIETSRIEISHQNPHIVYWVGEEIPYQDSREAKSGFDGMLRTIQQRPRRLWDYPLPGVK